MPRLRLVATTAILVAAAFGLTACVGSPLPEQPSSQGERPQGQTPEPEEYKPQFHAAGTATENLPYFTATLEDFVEAGGAVNGQTLVDLLASAGFDKGAMQVSFDYTKTDLVADAIFVSVRVDSDCLLGQVATSGGRVSTIVEPTVGPEKNLCLIGNTRPIDW